jgi:hypothetical protein
MSCFLESKNKNNPLTKIRFIFPSVFMTGLSINVSSSLLKVHERNTFSRRRNRQQKQKDNYKADS